MKNAHVAELEYVLGSDPRPLSQCPFESDRAHQL